MPDDLVTVRVPRDVYERAREAMAGATARPWTVVRQNGLRWIDTLAPVHDGEENITEMANAHGEANANAIVAAVSLADAALSSPPVEASEGDESDEALRAWREDGKAPRGTCPYCGAGISVVERDGWFRARCSHRMCGATGPRMRRLTRAVELFVTRPTRKVYVAVDAASVHPSSLTDVVAMLEDEIEQLRAEVARLRGAAEEACERANAAEHEARRQREKAETYGSMAYEANVILGGVGKRDERLLDAAKRVVAERDQAELFLEHVTSGGTIIATAALTPMQIAIARAADRMHVSQRGFGYVHVPGPRFCACGRVESDCDQSRASCPKTDHASEDDDETNAIGRIESAVGIVGAVPMAETVAAVERVVAERDQAELFLEHVTSGGTIIATAALTPTQIAIARAADRMHVSQRGFGYVYVPGPVGLAPLSPWTEGTIAGCTAATDGIVAWLRSKAETLRDTADEYTCEAHATEARVRASWCDVLADDIASGKHTENPYLKGSK